ncbi:nucleotide-binding oligomerization domain-containing protein 2 isoform X1 [Paramormyrops kingsleyae]|uniref:nucleotide-binding oligomerization domain-containing protein 2 isoform X1 n=2 Tax=Paramormyrops kingsleyae TaxID=1676925 RepID=UPI003B9768EF
MSACRLLQQQRVGLLQVLCSSGTAEILESVLDRLLAWDVLQWEDYQTLRPPNRSLCTSARELLDMVASKGEEACGLLLGALDQVLPGAQKASLSLGASAGGPPLADRPSPSTASQTLWSERPCLVVRLRPCIGAALRALVESGSLTTYDCDEVQLPINTPAQQARRLLDLVGSKGECAAKALLQFVERVEKPLKWPDSGTTFPAELLQYQKKLRSSVAAQSHFLNTYGGTGSLSLDDVYTEGLLEVSQGGEEAQRPIGLEDILGQVGTLNKDADMVLLLGEAGSGKTTLLQRLHLLWAREVTLENWILLFPFSCRRLSAEEQELSVRDLLFSHCCWPDRDPEPLFQFILDHPDRVLFTFDGLDEFRLRFTDEKRVCCPMQRASVAALLFSLLQGCLMQGVQKVVTSRPEAFDASLRTYIRKEVTLKGFSPERIDCFLRKQHRDPGLTSHVLQSLHSNTALFSLCHVPVLCWIVSQCYRELLGSEGSHLQTFTDVYIMILQHFLQRRCPRRLPLASGWAGGYAGVVLRLGRLALRGLQTACYVFSDGELQRYGVTDNDVATGFLIRSDSFSALEKHYEFLHVTMQCFFAALFVILGDDADGSAVFQLFCPRGRRRPSLAGVCSMPCLPHQDPELKGHTSEAERPNLQIMATFVSGLLSQRHRILLIQSCPASVLDRKRQQVVRGLSRGIQRHFRSIPRPVQGEKKSMHAMPEFVWLIKCIYEMQDDAMARRSVAKLKVEHLKLTYCNIGPVECSALAYVLQHLRSPVGLQLDYNCVGDVGVEQLLPCIRVCHSLYLRNNNISDEGIRKLTEKAVHFENFQKIALFNNKLTDACMMHFAELLKAKQNFLALRLGNNYITAVGAELLAEGLKENSSLKYLGLWGNKIKDRGVEALAKALQSNCRLVWLSLVDNGVGSAGARALAQLIKTSQSLEELWLSKNCITREGIEYLLEALQTNTSVKAIWLKGNDLSPEEVEELKQRDQRLTF